ncbi:MAG: DUF680 domain-containing protein [Rhizobiaceae bacterium]|nr:DUF680 domain-containing protein [Rhizobiaceae bacterium]
MKAISISLAIALAVSSAAVAGESEKAKQKLASKPAHQLEQTDLDKNITGSIKSGGDEKGSKPRLGIEINPFSFGTFH